PLAAGGPVGNEWIGDLTREEHQMQRTFDEFEDIFSDITDEAEAAAAARNRYEHTVGETALRMLSTQRAQDARKQIRRRLQRLVIERGLSISRAKELWAQASLRRLSTLQGGMTAERRLTDTLDLLEQTMPVLSVAGQARQHALVDTQRPMSRAQRGLIAR